MPQLIAMIIVVVGAMIYMFQTFGGTGDKIEGIAQKTSVITELNNIKNGIQLALRSGDITTVGSSTTLADLAKLQYFADQINNELSDNTTDGNENKQKNTYSAISFGGEDTGTMTINLIINSNTSSDDGKITARPGLRVVLSGTLADNAGFLESQLAGDLSATASIDRTGSETALTLDGNGNVPPANRSDTQEVVDENGTQVKGTMKEDDKELTDGKFTVYFKDIPASVIQAETTTPPTTTP